MRVYYIMPQKGIITMTLSLCMIVKNEENNLARCLDSASGLADEIIIVDTGSCDGTVEAAKQYTDKVYHFDWIDDFSKARNFSFSKAASDYCMWLDADDVILKDDFEKIKNLKNSLPVEIDVVMMPYNTAFDESGNVLFSYYRERIVRNSPEYRWEGRVHEAISPTGKVIYYDAAISHKKEKASYSDRNLRIYEKMIAQGDSFSPRDMFYYGRELYYHSRFNEAISVFSDFLSEQSAWIENKIDACGILADCYLAKDDRLSALSSLMRSLTLDAPRAEICCKIGEIMMENNNYSEAIFWYETALSKKPDMTSGAFVNHDCCGFIPAIWLCVCYDRLGDHEKACEYNNLALSFKPQSEAALSNKKYFETLKTEGA